MNKEQVFQVIELLRDGHSLTDITERVKVNVMYVSVIRKLVVMGMIKMD